MASLRIRQVRSGIGNRRSQRETLRSLGLRRIGQIVERPDTPSVRGLVETVRHLVTFEEIADAPEKPRTRRSSRKKAS